MEVSRIFSVVFVALSLVACGNQKSAPWENENNKSQACTNARIMNRFIVTWKDGHVSYHKDDSAENFDQTFVKDNLAKIEAVEYDRVISVHQDTSVSASAAGDDWGQQMTEAASVWAQGVYGQSIIVGVVDTGVDINHTQLAGRLTTGYNFVDNSANMNLGPKEDHGTHVSGIIGANHTTSPVKGMAPQVTIVPAKFLDGNGYGSTSGAISAMNYAVSRGAKIINASWGGPQCSSSLEQTFAKISAQGILLMTAAGNEGHDLDSIADYPAVLNMPNQITVSWLRADGIMAALSNTSYRFSNIAAPGDYILSLKPGNLTMEMSGTSMATPFVSGAAALLWSAKPNATPAQIRQAILSAVDPGQYRVSSQGRLNVRKALDALKAMLP